MIKAIPKLLKISLLVILLIHACIEGPRADLIYHGKTKLLYGKAAVYICQVGFLHNIKYIL